jgi:hypothetical protein
MATKTRPRGFITDWRPRASTLALLDHVQAVLAEYSEQLPLTLCQIFYRLVGRYFYEKTELAYERLGETLNKARRAQIIDMDAIRDDGFTSAVRRFYDGVDDFLETFASTARHLRFDRQAGQSRRLALWCEASGMVPQLERIANPFGVGVYSSGGFDSLTDKHRIGRQWSCEPITVLHLGDHDPSGVHCFSALDEDLKQARRFRLPSAPPKATDRRSFEGNETWQLEALDPRSPVAIVQSAIEQRFDWALYEAVLAEEVEARQNVISRLGLRS